MGILDSLENSPALKSALSQLGAAVLPVVPTVPLQCPGWKPDSV